MAIDADYQPTVLSGHFSFRPLCLSNSPIHSIGHNHPRIPFNLSIPRGTAQRQGLWPNPRPSAVPRLRGRPDAPTHAIASSPLALPCMTGGTIAVLALYSYRRVPAILR